MAGLPPTANLSTRHVKADSHMQRAKKDKTVKLTASHDGRPVVNPSTLIIYLTRALLMERPEFTFPYFLMHRRCWLLTHMIQKNCLARWLARHPKSGTDNPRKLLNPLWHARGTLGSVVYDDDWELMEASAKLFEEMISQRSGAMLKQMSEKFDVHVVFGREEQDKFKGGSASDDK